MDARPGSTSSPLTPETAAVVARELAACGQFGAVSVHSWGVEAAADGAEAAYRIRREGEDVWVSLVTADRWLSQSIEQQLVHTGDKLDELLEEELVDLDSPVNRLKVEHFRDDEKLFTFRSKVPAGADAALMVVLLRGYEACFRRLGDMDGGGE